jgi:broad specificity polyphosphatase/5'/3'-nucleotidase SurE
MIDAMSAVNSWVVRLAQTPLVRELKPQHYLTASIPRVSPKQIKGVRVAKRADLLERPVFAKATADDLESDEEVWRIAGTEKLDYSLPGDCDIALYNQGYIVVVPMLCDEHDHHLLSRLNKDRGALPEWALLEEKKCP